MLAGLFYILMACAAGVRGNIGAESHGQGYPMIENSVRFALDRCHQFEKLSHYLREEAFADKEISHTKKICDHILQLDQFELSRGDDEQGLPDLSKKSPLTTVLPQADARIVPFKKPEKKILQHETNVKRHCSVQLHESGDWSDDKPLTFRRKKYADTSRVYIGSLKVSGNCDWQFFKEANFRGDSFTVRGDADLKDKELSPPSEWGWRKGEIRSIRRGKYRKLQHGNNANTKHDVY